MDQGPLTARNSFRYLLLPATHWPNGELFIVLKMMVGGNLKDQQLQQIVDKTIMEADKNGDGKIDFSEFLDMVNNTDVAKQLTLGVSTPFTHSTGPLLSFPP